MVDIPDNDYHPKFVADKDIMDDVPKYNPTNN